MQAIHRMAENAIHHLKIMFSERYRQRDMQQADLIFIEGMLQLAEAGAGVGRAIEAEHQLFETFNRASRAYNTDDRLQDLIDTYLPLLPRLHRQTAGVPALATGDTVSFDLAGDMARLASRTTTKVAAIESLLAMGETTPQCAKRAVSEALVALRIPARGASGLATRSFVVLPLLPNEAAPTVISASKNHAYITAPRVQGNSAELADDPRLQSPEFTNLQQALTLADVWYQTVRLDMPTMRDLLSFPATAQNQAERAYRELAVSAHPHLRRAV